MRPFKITQEKHDELMEKFSSYLKSVQLTTNSFSFSQSVEDVKNKDKVFVSFSMKAYIKMRDLVDRYDSEVGWFGFIDKISDLEYHITDICVYPQLVTGATVKETNEPWDDDMPIEQIKRRHFHGHSHVSMMPNPSATDINHRDDQVAMLKSDSFYFFMITNKRCAWTAALFDLGNNAVYNTDDILIDVDLGDGEMLSDFVEETKKRVKTSTPQLVSKMMAERAVATGKQSVPVIQTTSNVYANPWLPEAAKHPKQPQQKEMPAKDAKSNKGNKKKDKNVKCYTGAPIPVQLGLSDFMTEKEVEDWAATDPDYFDDFFGHVSDTPSFVNREVLSMMR